MMSITNKVEILLGCAMAMAVMSGCAARENTATVTNAGTVATVQLSNPSEFARMDEVTTLSFNALGVPGTGDYRVVADGAELPSQYTDTDGDGQADALMFLANYAPAQSRNIMILNQRAVTPARRTQAEVSIKTGGAWEGKVYQGGQFENVTEVTPPAQYTDHSQYIRYEGPGIESDKVGYRFYLDWRNGFDIFGKTTAEPVLQNVGLDGYDSYHELAQWGADILKVGDAVGIGGYGFWDGQKIVRVSRTSGRATRVVENGPLGSTLSLSYRDWQTPEQTTDLRALLSVHAGSRLVHTRLEMSPTLSNIALGMVKHPDTEVIHGDVEISGHAWTYIATWGKQSVVGGDLGMALFFERNTRVEQTEDAHNLVSVMRPGNGKLNYYFAAAWSGEPNGITTRDEFVAWLGQEAEKLTMPLRTRLHSATSDSQTSVAIDASSALEWSTRLARSEIARLGTSLHHGGFDRDSNRAARWTYTTGLTAQAMDDLSQATGNPEFTAWGKANLDSYLTAEGMIRTYDAELFNIDHINPGKMLLRYLERTGEARYRRAVAALSAQLDAHPRTTEGAFWHKKRYPWQLWLDGVYMGMPFLAHEGLIEGDLSGVEEAVHEAQLVHRRLRDPVSGLYYHAWDEKAQQIWADPQTGLSRYYWSRGMGWYAMALVDLLDFVPPDRQDLRAPLIEIVRELSATLVAHQVDGVWSQIIDRPDETGNYLESSASSMFVYMLAKAVNEGYIDDRYRRVTQASFAALVHEFINVSADGSVSLNNICEVAGLGFGRDGSYRYYMSEPVTSNDPKGVGPFIMAGVQVSKMLRSNP